MLLALFLLSCSTVMAQVNPKAGYIIHLQNDTVYGLVDYRTDTRNSRFCVFKADGAVDYLTYGPSDISGYRLQDNGIFYVSRTFPVEGEMKAIFAEYLLQGGVSLYHYKENSIDYYYLVDANGKLATIREPHDLILSGEERRDAQRRKMAEVGQMLGRSPETLKKLWDMGEVRADAMVRILSEYNVQSGSAGDVIFASKQKDDSQRLITHFHIEVGLEMLSMSATPHNSKDELNVSGTVPSIGIGLDAIFPRLSRNVVFQAMVAFSQNKANGDSESYGIKKEAGIRFNDLSLNLGAVYRFLPENTVTPLLRCGMVLDYVTKYKTENWEGFYGNSDKFDRHTTASAGFYGGAGGEVVIGKQRLSLTANYVYRNLVHYSVKAPMFTINVGLVL